MSASWEVSRRSVAASRQWVASNRSCRSHLCVEYDDHEREAELYLFTRSFNDVLPDDVTFHHWALVFRFEGNDFRTAEGFGDEDDTLYPVYTKESPREQGKFFFLGKVFSSPAKVLEMTKANPQNDKAYLATWQNCQTWVKAIATMLGENIARKLSDFKTLKEAQPLFAFAGKISTGCSTSFRSRGFPESIPNTRSGQFVSNNTGSNTSQDRLYPAT